MTTAEIDRLRDACIAAGPTMCASCDGRCGRAGGTEAELGNLTRFLTYHDHHGYRAEARRLYAELAARRAIGGGPTSRPPATPARTNSISPRSCRGRMSCWANRADGVSDLRLPAREKVGRDNSKDSFRPGFSVASDRQLLPRNSVATTIAGWDRWFERHAGEAAEPRRIGWDDCQELGKLLPSAFRLAFDGSRLEIMVTTQLHDHYADVLDTFFKAVAGALRIRFLPYRTASSASPKSSDRSRPSNCYYLTQAKIDAGLAGTARKSKDASDYPNPDLAIEVDLSPPKVDREGIYAALKVAELWTFNGTKLTISRLGKNGRYRAVEQSGFLPLRRSTFSGGSLRKINSIMNSGPNASAPGRKHRSRAAKPDGPGEGVGRNSLTSEFHPGPTIYGGGSHGHHRRIRPRLSKR